MPKTKQSIDFKRLTNYQIRQYIYREKLPPAYRRYAGGKAVRSSSRTELTDFLCALAAAKKKWAKQGKKGNRDLYKGDLN